MNSTVVAPAQFRPVQSTMLPIFRQDHVEFSLFYAPGYLSVVEQAQADGFENVLGLPESTWSATARLREHAANAEQTWAKIVQKPFTPICLTLYLHNECNLGCTYCYANPSPRPGLRLEPAAVRAGATLVAQHCRDQNRPLTAVFHGGGEPMLHQHLTAEALTIIEQIADAHALPVFRYIATNGVMAARKAAWMADHFDLVGLSCDGSPELQNQQRPLWGGGASSHHLERTAQLIHDAGTELHVRVTVTPQIVHRQVEIATYICQRLQPQEIHVEPVYQAGRAEAVDCIEIEQAADFVAEFLNARAIAQQYNIPWRIAGSRPGEIHGPYCNVFRDVLNLVPGGVATACFKTTTAAQTKRQGVSVGELDAPTEHFVLHQRQVQSLRPRLQHSPAKCNDCFNYYHCVRNCPTHCPLEGETPSSEFGCQVQKQLVNAMLQEKATALWADRKEAYGVVSGEVLVH